MANKQGKAQAESKKVGKTAKEKKAAKAAKTETKTTERKSWEK
jgi:hypothetical protein